MPSSFIGQATGDPLPPEAASPLFPPAVSSAGLRKHLVGLGNLLDAQADFTGIDPQELAHTHIRAATYDIESELRMPFFVARFCSKTLADELGLIQGTDYDRITPPMSYRLRDWQVATGRLRLYWSPMAGNVEMLRLALTGNVIGPDIPVEWINPDLETAEVHIIPTSAASTTFALSAINPLYSVGQRSGVVPCFVHVRYSAGLVRLPSDHSLWNPRPPAVRYAVGSEPHHRLPAGHRAARGGLPDARGAVLPRSRRPVSFARRDEPERQSCS
jgi:hypothetical protein